MSSEKRLPEKMEEDFPVIFAKCPDIIWTLDFWLAPIPD